MKKKLFIICVISLLVLISCSTKKDTIINSGDFSDSDDTQVTISQSSLFDENNKKLEPHLHLNSSCVKIDYKGEKKYIHVYLEIWENGEVKEKMGNFANLLDDSVFDGELSISLKDIILDDGKISKTTLLTTSLSKKTGFCSSSKYIKRYPSDYAFSPYVYQEPFTTSDDEEISVIGLMAIDNSVNSYHQEDTIEATAKKANWALVAKILFKDTID
ncbi:MAG: hypothetical protein N4A63_17545 [Vallitalea sp.]|nr:hypothetical protein [Vallitalea sp.]